MSIIFHLDMNAFFASVEQVLNPSLRGRPVAVVSSNNYQGAAILARSYEAKSRGVASFMRLPEAKLACPELITITPKHENYYEFNKQLTKIMQQFTDTLEVYSIDEFFLDMTDYLAIRPWLSVVELAQQIKDTIAEKISPVLKCSIGVSSNKLLAKVGSDFKKPDGLTVIPWERRFEFLDQLSFREIWGIGYNSIPKLHSLGIHNTAQIRALDKRVLESLVGSYWNRLQLIANGECEDPVHSNLIGKPKKSMQHAHTLDRATSDLHELQTLARKLCEKLSLRLRKYQQLAGAVGLILRPAREENYGWGRKPRLHAQIALGFFSDHGEHLYQAADKLLQGLDINGIEVRLMAVTITHLHSGQQPQLLESRSSKLIQLDKAIDQINHKFGSFTLRSADILHQQAKNKVFSIDHASIPFHPG